MINKHFFLLSLFCALLFTFTSTPLRAQKQSIPMDSTYVDTTATKVFLAGSTGAILQAQFRTEKVRDSIRIAKLDSINRVYKAHLLTLQDSADAYKQFKDSLIQYNDEQKNILLLYNIKHI